MIVDRLRKPLHVLLCLTVGVTGSVATPSSARGEPALPLAAPGRFEFDLKKESLTSAGIFDTQGRLLRTLWSTKRLPSGRQTGEWDGRDEFGQTLPRGQYEYRVSVNPGSYRNVGIIGNSGATPASHTPGNMFAVAIDADDAVYTVNEWEEAGADFKKWDAKGKSVYDAGFQIRNGDPNGVAHAVALDDRYLYCATGAWPKAPFNAKQQIQRFRLSDGKHEPFTGMASTGGHIQIYEWPERKIPRRTPEAEAAVMKLPLRALVVSGETIYVCDALGGKILRFAKATGVAGSVVDVPLPAAITVGTDGRIWVGHERHKISVFHPDRAGKPELMIEDIGEVRALAFGPGDRLYVADGETGQIKIYEVKGGTARPIGGFGRKAVPGDDAPDRFYDLRGIAVDRRGGFVTVQALPLGGARLSRWSPVGALLWEQMGLEFVSLGTYARHRPDEFISLQFNRYQLARQGESQDLARFRGNLFAGDPKYRAEVHGAPRIVKVGDHELFFTAQGDGMQVFRREADQLRPAALIGGRRPTPDGRRDERTPPGLWTWHDADGDAVVDRDELRWFRRPGAGKLDVLGMNVDERGNVLYCDRNRDEIWELPILGADRRGNPLYNWEQARRVVARDTSKAALQPLMAVRSPDGQRLYAFSRSAAWTEPKNGGAWMGGWALSSYDANGTMLWVTPLPEVCVGMDAVPGGGVVLGWYEKGHVYHYNADGLHVGTAEPGPASGGVTGWLDNTAALAANRDPRDGLIDVFTSDNYLYRILWYRIDDRELVILRGQVSL